MNLSVQFLEKSRVEQRFIYESGHGSLFGVVKKFHRESPIWESPHGRSGQKMIHADSESSIFRGGKRACNGKYASTFLFRSRGTSIPATLNIHAILLTTFQTSLSTGTPFIFLDLRSRSSTLHHVARNGATRRARKNSLSRN